ncbi:MAG: hypothetical protein NVS4B12_16390 [Ktedonobacteraceae bacterium]
MPLSVIDILFLITVVLLVLSGLRNGLVVSLLNLISIPLALGVAYFFGPQFTAVLASTGFSATPLISFFVLFFLTVLVLHIIGNTLRSVVRSIPIVGSGDSLLGGVVGFVEAWLLWLFLLVLLGSFLHGVEGTVSTIQHGATLIPGANVPFGQLQQWHDFYNEAVIHSLFAKVNGFFVKSLPSIPQPPQ